MARIPYFDPALATGLAKEAFGHIPHLNLFRMMGHGGDLIHGFLALGNVLLFKGKLDPVLREIAIIRVGILSGCSYEIEHHRDIGRKLGMSEALLDAIEGGAEADIFSDDQRLVMRFADDLFANVRSNDVLFSSAIDRFGPGALQELVVVIGFYMMAVRFLETFEVDLEDGHDRTGGNLVEDLQQGLSYQQ